MDAIYKSLSARQRDLLIAAYVETGLPQTAVSRMLAASKPSVTGALNRLRTDGKLREEVRVDYGDDKELIWMTMRSIVHENLLQEVSGDEIKTLVVPRPPGSAPDVRQRRNTLRERERTSRFHQRLAARFAAQELLNFLLKNPEAKVGVSFGYTMEVMVEEFERLVAQFRGRSSRRFSRVTLFNYTGDFGIDPASIDADNPAARPLRYCSSAVCARMAQALRTRNVVQCHLPGWIPLNPDMSDDDVSEARRQAGKVFERYDSYRQIFGSGEDPGSLLRSADVLITGIGSIASVREYLKLTGRLTERSPVVTRSLRDAVGDMSCAILRKRSGDTGPTPLGATSVGPTLKDFQHVSDSARQSKGAKLGVLAVASGAEKAEALDAAVTAQAVNCVSLDTALANALLRLRGLRTAASTGSRPQQSRSFAEARKQ